MEFSEHGPAADPALGDDEVREPVSDDPGRPAEAGTDPARGADEEHPQAETPPN